MQRIVVGVDGSSGSHRALAWAVEEARIRGAAVEAVHVWTTPYVAGFPYTTLVLDPAQLEQHAHELLAAAIAGVDTAGLAVPVQPVVAAGGPAEAILAHAKGADLVVVGTRGRGGFTGLLLGSVSQQVVHHATCPVVIVQSEE